MRAQLSVAMLLPLELEDSRLDELLALWTRWMASTQPYRDLWYPDSATGCVGGGYSQTFEDMVEASEARTVDAVNGAIESLSPIEQCAVLHVHLYAVFRFRESLEEVYLRARQALKIGLPQRGIY